MPASIGVLTAVGLLCAVGFIVAIPLLGLRADNRYVRNKVRRNYSANDRRTFWAWAIAFPTMIILGCVLGLVFHLGKDWFTSEMAGAGIAGTIVIPVAWILQTHLHRRDQTPDLPAVVDKPT
jgi:hypothetical protein